MLVHKSDNQRRESLSYLTTAVSSALKGTLLPQPMQLILEKAQPLILDGSSTVRIQLLRFLSALPKEDIRAHTEKLLLYTRAGMTHLASDIRSSSLDVLMWLLRSARQEVITCPGGWTRTLKCLLSLLGWAPDEKAKWSTRKPGLGWFGSEPKLAVKQLTTLASFVDVGLRPPATDSMSAQRLAHPFPLCDVRPHMLREKTLNLANLNLFGTAKDEDSEVMDCISDRQLYFKNEIYPAISKGLEMARREGGDIGRAAGTLVKVLAVNLPDSGDDMVH